jgi:hypothetical protein
MRRGIFFFNGLHSVIYRIDVRVPYPVALVPSPPTPGPGGRLQRLILMPNRYRDDPPPTAVEPPEIPVVASTVSVRLGKIKA